MQPRELLVRTALGAVLVCGAAQLGCGGREAPEPSTPTATTAQGAPISVDWNQANVPEGTHFSIVLERDVGIEGTPVYGRLQSPLVTRTGQAIAEAGSVVVGEVVKVDEEQRRLGVRFDAIVIDYGRIPIDAVVVDAGAWARVIPPRTETLQSSSILEVDTQLGIGGGPPTSSEPPGGADADRAAGHVFIPRGARLEMMLTSPVEPPW